MFKPRPYDPNRIERRTPAQIAAANRNFEIFKLRGLWAQAAMLSEPFRSTVRALIDADLRARGALSQPDHQRAAMKKRMKKRANPLRDDIDPDCRFSNHQDGRPCPDCHIPF